MSSTSDAAPTPGTFTFIDQTDVETNTLIESNSITVYGVPGTNGPIEITSGTGEYKINDGAWTSVAGTVSNSARVTVRQTSSANYSTQTDLTLEINGISDTFSVTTVAPLAVTTQEVADITDTTATVSGSINGLGASNPTQHGICWSTSISPTITDFKTEEGAVSTAGDFTSSMIDLTANTTYYVRTFVTNSGGTTYGNQLSFTTERVIGITVSILSSTTTDEDGAISTFTAVLDSQPTDDVLIPLSSNDTSEGTVLPASLTFTTGNWDTPQTVTITGVNDDLLDGDIAYIIEIGPAVSTDNGYNGNDPADKSLTNNDNDLDSDGDGISDTLEGTGDNDFDGVEDCYDYDPTGYLYDSATGEIISGGSLFISGPGTASFVAGQDGTNGYYQFVVDQTGEYTIEVTPPDGYSVDSSGCAASGTLTADGTPNPLLLGSSEDGTTGYLADYSCDANKWHLTIIIQDTTPLILNNNIPLVSNESIPTLNEWGMIISSSLLAVAALTVLRRKNEVQA